MNVYPLVFGIREAVAGHEFLAGVSINGKVLLEHEDEAWWVSGVQPGGLAASGETPEAAYQAFRRSLKLVLFDSAHLAETFEEFKADVEGLGCQENPGSLARWEAARELIRNGVEVGERFAAELPRIRKKVPIGTIVVRLDHVDEAQFQPRQNKPDRLLTAA